MTKFKYYLFSQATGDVANGFFIGYFASLLVSGPEFMSPAYRLVVGMLSLSIAILLGRKF